MFKINMINSPRCSGKTTRMKFNILETFMCMINGVIKDTDILVITHSNHMKNEYLKWLKELGITRLKVMTAYEFSGGYFRGKNIDNYTIFMDEPFNVDVRIQNTIIKELRYYEECRPSRNIVVYGEGTKEVGELERFSDFIYN